MKQEMLDNGPRSRSLHEALADSLRECIFRHELLPGEAIEEYSVVVKYGVTRPPVREALNLLAREGLVAFEDRRACRVANPSDQDIAQLFDLLELLEEYAVRQAVSRGSTLADGAEPSFSLWAVSGNSHLRVQMKHVLAKLKLAFGPVLEAPETQPTVSLHAAIRHLIENGLLDQVQTTMTQYWTQRRQVCMSRRTHSLALHRP